MAQTGLLGVILGDLASTKLHLSSTGQMCPPLPGYQRGVLSVWVFAASSLVWVFAVKFLGLETQEGQAVEGHGKPIVRQYANLC